MAEIRGNSVSGGGCREYSELSCVLSDCCTNRPVTLGCDHKGQCGIRLSRRFRTRMSKFRSFLAKGVTTASVPNCIDVTHSFFYFLRGRKVRSFKRLGSAAIVRFVMSYRRRRPTDVGGMYYTIEGVLRFLYLRKYAIPVRATSCGATPDEQRVRPTLSDRRLRRVLSIPKESAPVKGESCTILLLTSFANLETVSVTGLQFSGCRPRRKAVRLGRRGAKGLVKLPIPTRIVRTIGSCVRGTHPSISDSCVFLALSQPCQGLSSGSSMEGVLVERLGGDRVKCSPKAKYKFRIFHEAVNG